MSLWSFIQERCSVLGIPVARMAEKNNISNITLERIKKNGQIKPATKEKLARGMLCTIREIDTAIAQDEQVTPFGETVKPEQPSVMETVDKLEKLITPEPEEEVDVMFPEEAAAEETLAEFKARMKDMCLYEFIAHGSLEEAKVLIAENLLEELLK